MANWTSPHIWSVAEEATSPLFNQNQRDNLQYLYDRLVELAASGFESAGPLTLTTGTWLLLAQGTGAALQIRKEGVNQVTVNLDSSDQTPSSLVWSAVITAASESWLAHGSGTVTLSATRVAV
jgi:hypothetical protein